MNDFWKRPSFIAAIIIAACYFLLPYYQVKTERGKDKGTISFTGMAFLTEKASFKGGLYEDLKDKQKKKATEAFLKNQIETILNHYLELLINLMFYYSLVQDYYYLEHIKLLMERKAH